MFAVEKNKRLRRKGEDDQNNRIYACPVCNNGDVIVKDNVFYGRCDRCQATLIDYEPLEHQEAFHLSNAQYRLNIGGYGSGKTTASCAEIAQHAMEIKNGKSLITAPTLSLVHDAVWPELVKFLPPHLIAKKRLRPSPYVRLTNGHEIIVYSSADQEKLRSLNLSAFYIEEASAVPYAIFDQLMTRLRHKSAIIRDKNGEEVDYKYMGILSTNPEECWLKDDFLFVSDEVHASPSIDKAIYEPLMSPKRQKHFHSFLSSTRDNKHIPNEFIDRMIAGKTAEWIRVYVDCYLDRREGAVFNDMPKYFVEPFEISKAWQRVAGFDPGYNDETAFLIGAIDPKDGCIYIYDEHYQSERPISYHARVVANKVLNLKMFMPIQADPSVRKRNDRDGISYADYFNRLTGIYLEPANNDIMFGIEKVRDYMHSGKLKFFNTCLNLRKEGGLYIYSDNTKRNSNDKPVDKYNHLMDTLRYLIAKLPRDPREMENVYRQSINTYTSGMFGGNDRNEDDEEREGIYGGVKVW